MSLLLVFVGVLLLSQGAAVATALVVEQYTTAYTGLVVFLGLFFVIFWLAWHISVWLTVPGKRLGAFLSRAKQ